MAQIDPGKAQAVCGNVFWIKTPVGDMDLNDLEQNTHQEQGNEGDDDNLLTFFLKGKKIQRSCNKITHKVQPETRTKPFG